MRRPARERFRSLATMSLIVLTSLATAVLVSGPGTPAAQSAAATATVSVSWPSGSAPVAGNKVITARVVVKGGTATTANLWIAVANGRFTSIPRACRASDILTPLSSITPDLLRLKCSIGPLRADGTKTIDVPVKVANLPGNRVYVSASLNGGPTVRPPYSKLITEGPSTAPHSFRFLSSPDFLNADVADLARPGSGADWDPAISENSTNDAQEQALDTVLDEWGEHQPDNVLVAGDLVNGHWGKDSDHTGNFGPVETFAEKQTALKRAAITYYPAWEDRLAEHGFPQGMVFPAMGDHEYGDDPWTNDDKRRLAPTFREEWANQFTVRPNGLPRFEDRPVGSEHELTSYAWRPHPEVQMVTIDVFDDQAEDMLIRVDPVQMLWLRRVLQRAQSDGVDWIIVQGHTPIVGPVRKLSSSGLLYSNGASSELWGVFKKYGVDLYLTGEVHSVTEVSRDGIVQIAHGGLFVFAHSNYLVGDVYPNRIELRVHDFAGRWSNLEGRLWETQMPGAPKDLTYKPDPPIIGTTTVWKDGRETARSGALLPYTP
jgi:hypothetical protein